jgi:hypothetical protein
VLKEVGFRRVIPEVHDQLRKRRMSQEEIARMLEIINAEGSREKDAWMQLAKSFPQFSKEEIIHNFLEIPNTQKMNANIFDSNEDFVAEKEPPMSN